MALFWKKTNVTTNPNEVADVTLYSYYKDLAEGQNSLLYTQGGPDGLHALFQFPVAPTPLSGQGKIKRFDLKFYVSNIDASNRSSGALSYDIYNLTDGIELTEGNINRERDDVLVFGSNPSSKTTFSNYTNNFNNVTPDASAVYDDVAFNMIKGKPYLSLQDAQDLAVENQDILTMIGLTGGARQKVADLYVTRMEGARGRLVVPIMKGDEGYAWPAETSGKRQKYFWRVDNIAFGNWNDIGSKIRWSETIQAANTRPEAESKKLISYKNSHFNVISTAQDINLDGQPHMLSDIKVSTTDGVDGPAIEFINQWNIVGDDEGSYTSDSQPAMSTGLRCGEGTSNNRLSQDSFACMRLPMPVRLESNFKAIEELNTKGYEVNGKLSYSPAAPMELVFDMKIPQMGAEYVTRDRGYGDASASNRTRLTTHRAFIFTFSNFLPEEGESFGYHISRMVEAAPSGYQGHDEDALMLDNSFSALIFVADSDGDEEGVRVYSPAQITNRSSENSIKITGVSTNVITLDAAHALTNGDTVKFYQNTSSPDLPNGLNETTEYYVINSTSGPASFKVSLTKGGTAVTISDAGTGDTFVYRAPGETDRLDLYAANVNGFADGGAKANLGKVGVIAGSPLGRIPMGTWLKVRMTFDVTGGIADNYLTYTNSGRADFVISTSDGRQLVNGIIPKCEFPSDNNVWAGIEGLGYANYHTALQFDSAVDAADGDPADKTVLENTWSTPVSGRNYGWTPYFTIWNTNRKMETDLGGANLAYDEAQPNRSGDNVPAKEGSDSINKLLIDNITIYNAEHQKSNMSPTFKSSRAKSGKIINNEPTITGYRTGIDGGESTQLATCYINVGFKNKSDFTSSSGFWLWNNYGTSDTNNTTSIMDAAIGAGYSTRNEYLGDQFGILSQHDDDAEQRRGAEDSGYTSQGGTTNRETGVFINRASFTDATCDYDSTDTGNEDIVTHNANASIVAGLPVSGTGIPAGATIASITDSTHFVLSEDTTGGDLENQTLTFGGDGYDAAVTNLIVDDGSGGASDSLTKFKRGDLVGTASGTIIGKVKSSGGTFSTTNIPIETGTQIELNDNDELYNIRYNQNYYQRINIGANPSSAGNSTVDIDQCWTIKDDTTLQTSGSANFSSLVVGQTITGFNVPTGTTIVRIDSNSSLEMSNNATANMTTSPSSGSPSNTFTFDYTPLRLPRIYTENSVGDSLYHSVNNFTQKGFTKFIDGGSSSLWGLSKTDSSPKLEPGQWTKREHMGASTRILEIKDTNKFKVGDETVCNIADDEDYIIYLAYNAFSTKDLVTEHRDVNWIAPVRISKDGDWFKIVSATLSGGKVITNLAQFNTTFSDVATASNFIQTNNIGRIFICPYRYWISISVNSAAYDYYVDRADSYTQKTGAYETSNNVPTPNRHYSSIIPVDSSTTVGSTFNESSFYYNTTTNKAPYFNKWGMDISTESKTNAVELKTDFGYGEFDEEEGNGGMVKNSNFTSGFNICKLDELHEKKKYEAGDLVTLYMTTADGNIDHNISIYSSQNDDIYRIPELLTVYEDEVPKSPSLSLSSMEETPNSVKFTWGNQDGDLWYGLLLIDTMNIDNQYHKSIGHLPLNENIEGTPTAYNNMYMKYYNVETANTLAIAGRWLNDITGIAGYTKDFTSVHGYRDGGTANNILYDTDGNFSTKDVQVGDSVYNMTKINAGITTDISTTVSAVDSNSQLTLVSYSVFDSFQEYEVSPRFLQFGDTALLNTPTKLSGTVYITDGATTLNGVSTSFTTELTQGQEIRIVDTIVTVASITSDIALEISSAYSPTAASDTISAPGVSITRGNSNYKFQKEFSVVAHVVPNKVALTGEAQYIFKKENSIEIKRLPAGIVRAEVKYGSNTSDFVRVDSTTRLPTDGETATCIILTVDTAIKYGNVKLYINGKLEDQSGKRLALPEQGKAWKGSPTGYGIYWDNAYTYFIGAGDIYGRNSFEGRIEEVVFYERIIYPISPQDEEFIFAKPVSEVESAGSSAGNFKVYSSKLFLKDYHNIRGTTIDEVASSNQVSFKKSSFLIEG